MEALIDRMITTLVSQFCQMTGTGRTRLYELLNDGFLDSIRIGKRRLIVLDSYRRLIEQQRGSNQTPTAGVLRSRRNAVA
jgi:hypothetical protein